MSMDVSNLVGNLTKEEHAQLMREIMRQEIKNEVAAALAPLYALIAISQKDVADLTNVSARTVSSKIATGEIPAFAADGSRRNFVTLSTVKNLKKRRPRK